MSDDLYNAFHQHSVIHSLGTPSDGHDALTEAFKHDATPHDDLTNAFQRHPYSLDSHPTEYRLPLDRRTESDYSSLPLQPDKVDNAWDYMHKAFKDVWGSKEHSVFGKTLETLSIPGEAVANSLARATHTDMAKPHDTVGQWYNILEGAGPKASGDYDAAYYSRLAGAWGATLLTDPLNYIGMGPTEHAMEGARALKMAAPKVVDAIEALSKVAKPLAETVHAPKLNTKSIQDIAAPMLVQERIGQVVKGLQDVAQHPATEAATADKANDMAMNLAQMQGHLTAGGATPEYTAMRDSLRAKSSHIASWGAPNDEFSVTPWGVKNHHIEDIPKLTKGMGAEDAFKAADQFLKPDGTPDLLKLARHQVLKERQIEHGMSSVRLFGGKTPIPSPFPAVGQGVNRLFGKYNKQSVLSGTVGELEPRLEAVSPGSGKAFTEGAKFHMPPDYIQRLTGGDDISKVPVSEVYNYLQHLQMGTAVEGSHQTGSLPLQSVLTETGPLQTWFKRHVQHWDIPERPKAVEATHGLYNGLAQAFRMEPELRARNTYKGLQKATETIRAQAAHPEFKDYLDPSRYYAPGGVPTLPTYPEQTAHRLKEGMSSLFGSGGHITNAMKFFDSAFQGNNPNDMVRAVESLHNWYDAELPTLEKKFQQVLTAVHDHIYSHTPFDVQQSVLKDVVDAQKEGRQASTILGSFRDMMDGNLRGPRANGLEMLGRMDPKTIEQAMLEYSGQRFGPKEAVNDFLDRLATASGTFADKEAMATHVKSGLAKGLEAMEKDGRMTPENVVNAKTFLLGDGTPLNPGLDAEGLYRATKLMHSVAAGSEKTLGPVEELRSMDGEAFDSWFGGLTKMDTHVWNHLRLPYESQWNAMQWTHAPNKLGRLYNRVMEPAMHAVMRHAGWPQRLIEVFNEWDGRNAISKRESVERKALTEWHGKHLPEAVAPLLGRTPTAQELHAIDQAIVSVEDYGPGRLSAAQLATAGPKDLRIHQIADEEYKKGLTTLEAIFPGKSKQAADAIMGALDKHIATPWLDRETKAGLTMVRRGRYMPRYLTGTFKDQREFRDTLDQMRRDEEEIKTPPTPNSPVVSDAASFEERREYPSAAHHQYDIDQVNEYRKRLGPRYDGPKEPLQVGIDRSLASRIAMRHQGHLRALNSVDLINNLADALPSHVLSFLSPRTASRRGTERYESVAAQAKALGFKNVKDLVPKLDGWHVNPKLYDFMKTYVNPYEDPNGIEEVENVLGKPLHTMQKYIKAANVSFSSTHIRNTLANGLVAGGPALFKRAAELVGEASRAYSETGPKKWFSPVLPLARALENHPLYEKGVKYGLFRGGAEYELPAQDLIRMRMNPHGLSQSMLGWAKHRVGPMNALTFDVVDRSLRMALFEKFIQTGMTESRAAEMANFRMLDYSMRWMTPSARKVLQGAMPFPSWTIGNLMLHPQQALRNPFYYSVLHHATEAYNAHEDGVRYPSHPEMVAGAIALKHTVPGTNNQAWLQPHLPWQAPLKLVKDVGDELLTGHPLVAGEAAAKYGISRLFEIPFNLKQEVAMRGGLEGAEKAGWVDMLLGKKGTADTGMLGRTFWGAQQYGLPGFFKVWFEGGDPQKAYHEQVRLPLPGADVRGFVEGQGGQVQGVAPGGKFEY